MVTLRSGRSLGDMIDSPLADPASEDHQEELTGYHLNGQGGVTMKTTASHYSGYLKGLVSPAHKLAPEKIE
jgi:hypothetical protein